MPEADDTGTPGDSTAQRHGGYHLSDVADLAVDSSGRLYALDRDFKKIVVFSPGGEPERVILGGYGEGPGEFLRPFKIGLSSQTQTLFVLDSELDRVSRFSFGGEYIGSFQLAGAARPRGLAITGDSIWVLTAPSESNATDVVHIYSQDGRRLGSKITPTKRALSYAKFGEHGTLGVLRDGGVAYLTGVPAVWTIANTASPSLLGAELFPERDPRTIEHQGNAVRVTPGGVRGIGEMSDGRVLVSYYELDPTTDITTEVRFLRYVAVFRKGGGFAGVMDFPDSIAGYLKVFWVDPRDQAFYSVAYEPYPRIVKFAVQEVRP